MTGAVTTALAPTPRVFSAVGLPDRRRIELWEGHNAAALIGLRCQTSGGGPLAATEINARAGQVQPARVAGSPHVVERTAAAIARALELKHYEFNAHGVEFGQFCQSAAVVGDGSARPAPAREVTDLYFDWGRLREAGEGGALLVRPDKHLGWRSMSLPADPQAVLRAALSSLLDRADAA